MADLHTVDSFSESGGKLPAYTRLKENSMMSVQTNRLPLSAAIATLFPVPTIIGPAHPHQRIEVTRAGQSSRCRFRDRSGSNRRGRNSPRQTASI